ncbi:major facilitator super transporter protein [Yamadazyma tenuis]|uniref:major facilitator superfamily transporter protein n=1 Tax=Candida tenuis TaxID=2315449 RepID=UPI0027A812E7|nr:major facilitator super transporter protein [Yamadazyma tenuis]
MKLSWFPVIVLLVINVGSFLLFLKGFFPSKRILDGFSDVSLLGSQRPMFDKVVVMVIDALRSDFLFSKSDSKFTFVHELIESNKAIPFTAFSNPPTVTLPRLKGITLGSTPNFLDAILNIADDKDKSQGLLNQDNWLHQFKYSSNSPKTINFYGDDTWLKLFPDFFNSTDGTNSFFVSDFYEVDNNVTRHLDNELASEANWDGLILHYLGLDHIGHKTGPDSKFMKLKQEEMDKIIERIYTFLSESSNHKNTLFLVMGDHGMNEIGNHGGSSSGETSAALLFVSPKFEQLKLNLKAPLPPNNDYNYYQKVNQIDIIPTLSLLLNIPIAKNNLGIIIRQFLDLFPSKLHHSILLHNCKQFLDLFHLNNRDHSLNSEFHGLSTTEDDYIFLRKVQDIMFETASNYNYSNLYLSLFGSFICTLAILAYFNYGFLSKTTLVFQTAMVLYSFHFHGSSLVEEEHHLWWLLNLGFLGYLFKIQNFELPANFLIVLTALRVIKAWSNTGQKFNNYYVLTNLLLENPPLLWFLVGLTYLVCGSLIYFQGSIRHCFNFSISSNSYDVSYLNNDVNNGITFVSLSILATMSFSFKLLQGYMDGYDIPEWLETFISWNLLSFDIREFDKSRISNLLVSLSNNCLAGVLLIIFFRIALKFLRGFKIGLITDLVNLLTLFLINQTKIELVPMFLIFFIIKHHFSKILLSYRENYTQLDQLVFIVSSFSFLISNLTFFSMGGTNSLATVDLSNAYNGIKSYQLEKVRDQIQTLEFEIID